MEPIQWRWPRQHTKSRTGCRRCKLRKVKCDEAHPECRNCLRLGAPCSYAEGCNSGEGPSEARLAGSTSLSPQPGARPARVREEGESRVLELRLLHEFVTAECRMLPTADDRRIAQFWTMAVPQMGFEHEFLLDAILGTTALQMAVRQRPPDRLLAYAGQRYYSRAVSNQRAALATIDRSTAEPVCVASILIMLMTFKVYCQRPTTPAAAEPYMPPVHWVRMVQGMGGLIRHCYALLGDDGIRLLMHKAHPPPTDAAIEDQLPQLPDLAKLLYTTLEGDSESTDSLLEFARLIRGCFAAASSGASRSEVRYELLGFVALSDQRFLQLIERKHPLTLVLLSHYFALLRWSGGNWWLQGELDAELGRMYQSIPQQYKWAVTV